MKKYSVLHADRTAQIDNAEMLREYLEDHFEELLGFYPMFQESEDEGYLEVYLHSDSYVTLGDEELTILKELNISESDSLNEICSFMNISIQEV